MKAKKLLAIVLAALLVFALAVPAFAASTNTITINRAQNGETYSAYKMFDLEVNDDLSAYSYTVNSAWSAFFGTGGAGAAFVDIDDQGYVVIKDGKVAELAAAAAVFAANLTAVSSDEAEDDTAVIEGLDAGYYLVLSTAGTIAMTKTTPADPAELDEKNPVPDSDKTVKESNDYTDENGAQIGDVIPFQVTIHAKKGGTNYVYHDVMTSGLTFNDDIAVSVGGNAVASTNYTVSKGTNGYTFEIKFTQAYLDTITAATDIVIDYSATLNTNAVTTMTQTNTGKLTWGENGESETDITTTKTYKFQVLKYAKGDDTKALLPGAVFSLKSGDSVVKLVKLSDTQYRVAVSTDSASATTDTFVTVDSGNIEIIGIDDSVAYTLKEVTPPSGYNALAEEVEIDLEQAVIEVENSAGSELPETGGAGTVAFIAIGAALFMITAVVLVTKKRMYNEG